MSTSWEKQAKWYDEVVSDKGHYYHKQVIFPKLKKLIKGDVLDLGCGNGALSEIVKGDYVGVDASKSLIAAAKKRHGQRNFYVKDVTQPFDLKKRFETAVCALAMQNMEDPLSVMKNAYAHLDESGQLIVVLNHPCFRIPRQSHWGVDESKKLQYRRIDRYMSALDIPIRVGKDDLVSFHHPLSYYFANLKRSGFLICDVQEWCSDKKSNGKAAKMENRARDEFPLFLTIVAKRC